MKTRYFILLAVVLTGSLVYWYQSTALYCPAPIAYRIDSIDEAFQLTPEEAREYAARAEAVWEERTDRELFQYDETAPLQIRFVYDDRQANADTEAIKRAALDAQLAYSEEIQESLTTLQKEYETLSKEYEARAAAYEAQLLAYNTEVNRYNDRGGAPPEEFSRLETEREQLNTEAETLNQVSAELSTLATEINRLAEQGKQLVDAYNKEVGEYNNKFGYAHEFTQGDYRGDEINVYKFSSDEEVVAVLAHEFGHALGIGHVEGTSSLMYYLLEEAGEPLALSSFDLESFEEVCGYAETFAQKVRRMIREALTIVN